jgi:UDP-N-acetylglucosamine acyltransferase
VQRAGKTTVIHDSAIIDPGARLGQNVSVGAYSVIGADVEIGDDCWIGPHAVINGPCRIGRNNRIFQFSSVGEAPQDKKFAGERTWLEIGDDNVIREFVTLNRGTGDGGGKTVIGSSNLFMAYTHVAHDCMVGDHVIFSNAASLAGHVEVGDHVILGGFTSVHQFTKIGAHAFCGLGSVITQDVPPFSSVAGNRARVFGINKEGLKRRGFSAELIRALHKSFRLLLASSKSRDVALQELQPLINEFPEVGTFTRFIVDSERGIAR